MLAFVNLNIWHVPRLFYLYWLGTKIGHCIGIHALVQVTTASLDAWGLEDDLSRQILNVFLGDGKMTTLMMDEDVMIKATSSGGFAFFINGTR